jgi:hypothetical protein
VKQILLGTVAVVVVSTFALAATAAQGDQQNWHKKHKHYSPADRETVHNPEFPDMNVRVDPMFPGMNAGVVRPSVEWDCSGGDAGCSWEPYGWRRN